MASKGERGNKLKRFRVGSDDKGIQCERCDNIVADRIECSGCQLEYCLKCANISEGLYRCTLEGGLENFLWSCKSCRATFPSIQNISEVLKDIQKNTDKRIESLESRVSSIENKTTEVIQDQIQKMKVEVIDSVKDGLDKLVDSRAREIEDRKRREMNLIVFNLVEHRSPSGEENKKRDEENIKRLSASLGLENPQYLTCFRLG